MDEIIERVKNIRNKAISWFREQSTANKIGLVCLFSVYTWITILILINHQKIIEYIVNGSDRIKDSGFKGISVFIILLSVVSFPPLIGFSSLCIMIGIVYGFSGYWMITITSSIMSTVSLCTFKYFFKDTSRRIIDSNERLELFVSVIKDESTTFFEEVFILTLMKLCPLPYSITNGGLGCVPHLSPVAFFIACIICSPKYFIQLFLGIQLRKIGSIDKDSSKKTTDLIIILVTTLSFAILSMLLYKRLQKKIQKRAELNGLSINEDSSVFLDII
jgi:uncharacterized membrane protein YdjX (TVP38/TMEM64 family)